MSHPIVLVVGDRRYRLKNLQDGEVAIYDDLGQKVHLTRDGIRVDAGPAQKVIKVNCGQSEMVIAKDHIQMKKPGEPSLHITLDIANTQLVAGMDWVIASDPYPQD
jgi:phage gp45-like